MIKMHLLKRLKCWLGIHRDRNVGYSSGTGVGGAGEELIQCWDCNRCIKVGMSFTTRILLQEVSELQQKVKSLETKQEELFDFIEQEASAKFLAASQ